jgi:hypothetical protein
MCMYICCIYIIYKSTREILFRLLVKKEGRFTSTPWEGRPRRYPSVAWKRTTSPASRLPSTRPHNPTL